MSSRQLFYKLLRSNSEDEIKEILDSEGLWEFSKKDWKIYGGDNFPNNKGIIQAQASSPEGAIVEKITNGIDAILLQQAKLNGIDPFSDDAPRSVSDAVEQFFGVKGGDWSELYSKNKLKEYASKLQLFTTGSGAKPCVTIVDQGEGQSVNTIEDTFLSLAKTLKANIPFVQGMFHMGGSATLRYSGKYGMNLIATRKDPRLASSSDDEWCFTIIRKVTPEERDDKNRNAVYFYLAPKGKVMTFGNAPVEVLPNEKGIQPYTQSIDHGSIVKCYNYDWKGREYFNKKPRIDLENILTRFPIPGRISDCRDFVKGDQPYNNLVGIWVRHAKNLNGGLKTTKFSNKSWPELGQITATYGLFPDDEDTRNFKPGVYLTINGHTHGTFLSTLLSKAGFSYLRKYLRIEIEGSQLDQAILDDMITTSRDQLARSGVTNSIEKLIIDEFSNNAWLKDKEAEYQAKRINQKLENNELEKQISKELLKSNPMFAAFLLGKQINHKRLKPDVEHEDYEGKYWPTYFVFEENEKEFFHRNTPINYNSQVQISTNATDDYFSNVRGDEMGKFTCEPNYLESIRLSEGTLYLNFYIPDSVKVADDVDIKITISDSDMENSDREPFVLDYQIGVLPEHTPKKNGTSPKGKTTDPSGKHRQEGKQGLPPINWKSLEELHDIVDDPSAEDSVFPIGNDWYANEDNKVLQTTLSNAKPGEDSVLKAKFGIGLQAVGISMKQNTDFYDEKELIADDVIRILLRSSAHAIVPIINLP